MEVDARNIVIAAAMKCATLSPGNAYQVCSSYDVKNVHPFHRGMRIKYVVVMMCIMCNPFTGECVSSM